MSPSIEPAEGDAGRIDDPRKRPVHSASVRLGGRSHSFEAQLSITTSGLLAVGAMVTGILLGVAAVVVASTRKLPDGTRPRDL